MANDMISSCGHKLVHIPVVLGAVLPVFNVPGVTDLRLQRETFWPIFT